MKKMLIITSTIFFTFILVLSTSANSQIVTETIDIDVNNCTELAKDFIENFYSKAYLNKELEYSVNITDSFLKEIVQAKFDDTQAPRILSSCRSFYIIFKEVSSFKERDIIYIQLPIAFYYFLDEETESCGSGRPKYFKFRKTETSYVLENWYTSSDGSLDFTLYTESGGAMAFLTLEQYVDWAKNPIDYSRYTEKALNRVERRESYFLSLKNLSEKEISEIETNETLSITSFSFPKFSYGIYHTNNNCFIPTITDYGWIFDRTSIANWARENYDSSNIESGSTVISYTDFSLYGEWDCTNFASHALSAGGASMYRPNGTTNRSIGWWSQEGYTLCSSSWSGVDSFYDFLINNAIGSGLGPFGIGAEFVQSIS